MTTNIDECAPWPTTPESAAEIARATIEHAMRHATDEALEAVFEAAGELATAAAADHGSAESWITGAAFAYGTVFCRLLDKMPLAELRELIEDIAGEVAPTEEEAREQEIRHKLEAFDAFHAQTSNAGRLP